jgi:LytS/YehU family sensor histidine kinase
MLLQPVVENAIKHGVEPKIEGGRIDVAVRREGDRLLLVVTDSGLGVRATRDPGSTGLGLANLRARLAALYGGAGVLTIADHAPAGTRVTISIPVSDGR